MPVDIKVDTSRIDARLEAISPRVRRNLLGVAHALEPEVERTARQLAAAHIHTFGKKPGQYLASIHGGVVEKPNAVLAYVRSGDPLAHLLEFGATLPAHPIFPKRGQALKFSGAGGAPIFARRVDFPGADVPAFPAIQPALEQHRSEIVSSLTEAVKDGARG